MYLKSQYFEIWPKVLNNDHSEPEGYLIKTKEIFYVIIN